LGKQNFFSILAKQVKDHSKFSWLARENSNGRVLLFQDSRSSPFTKQKRGSTQELAQELYVAQKRKSCWGTRGPKQAWFSKMLEKQ
jgi:hypothetical protein